MSIARSISWCLVSRARFSTRSESWNRFSSSCFWNLIESSLCSWYGSSNRCVANRTFVGSWRKCCKCFVRYKSSSVGRGLLGGGMDTPQLQHNWRMTGRVWSIVCWCTCCCKCSRRNLTPSPKKVMMFSSRRWLSSFNNSLRIQCDWPEIMLFCCDMVGARWQPIKLFERIFLQENKQ